MKIILLLLVLIAAQSLAARLEGPSQSTGSLLAGLTLRTETGDWVLESLKVTFRGHEEELLMGEGRIITPLEGGFEAAESFIIDGENRYQVWATALLEANCLRLEVTGDEVIGWEAGWRAEGTPITRLFLSKGFVMDKPTLPYELRYPVMGHATYMRGHGLETEKGALYCLVDGVATRFWCDGPKGQFALAASCGTEVMRFYWGAKPFARLLIGLRDEVALKLPDYMPNPVLKGRQYAFSGATSGQMAKEMAKPFFQRGITDLAFVQFGWMGNEAPNYWPPRKGDEPEQMRAFNDICFAAGALYCPYDNQTEFGTDAPGYDPKAVMYDAKGDPIIAWTDKAAGKEWHAVFPWVGEEASRQVHELLNQYVDPQGLFIDVVATRFFDRVWDWEGKEYNGRELFDGYAHYLDTAKDIEGNGNGLPDRADPPIVSEDAWEWQLPHVDTSQAYFFPYFFHGNPAPHDWFPHLSLLYHRQYADFGMGWYAMYAGDDSLQFHNTEDWTNEEVLFDDYISAQILMGEAGFLWPDVFSPVRQRVAYIGRLYYRMHAFNEQVFGKAFTGFEYEGDSLFRTKATYDDGTRVWVNRGEGLWNVEGRLIAPVGLLV